MKGISFDRRQNIMSMTFNGAILFSQPNRVDSVAGPGLAIFSFATYTRQNYIIPDDLKYLQSNRFDVQLLTEAGEQVTSDVLDFLIDFLFKLKAFHSLLNVIIYSVDLNEVYNVTDICAGGNFFYRYDTEFGRIQVPPAKIPGLSDISGCMADASDLGFTEDDILYRSRVRALLDENFEAWKVLDSRGGLGSDSSTRLEPNIGSTIGTCQFTPIGQDRIELGDKTVYSEIVYDPGPNSNSGVQVKSNSEESPISIILAGSWYGTGTDASTSNDSRDYSSFVREYSRSPNTFCELDGFNDYCYKGRVDDEVLHRSALFKNESFRSHACQLSMGDGYYYMFPAMDRYGQTPYLDSIQTPYLRADVLEPYQDSWMGRLLRSYGTPEDYTLHYTNRDDFVNYHSSELLALQRPSLNIDKPDLHFPGTRFVSMSKMFDFTHPTYRARPWDDEYSTICGPPNLMCGNGPTYLNAVLIENEDGDFVLSHDDVPYTIYGNGMHPDVPSLGYHEPPSGFHIVPEDVIHSIYIDQYESHSAITLDNVGDYGSTDGYINTTDPVFLSAGVCVDGSYIDYEQGYPCTSGYQALGDLDLDRDGLYKDALDAMGVPYGSSETSTQILFLLASGIRNQDVDAYRLDCGCLYVECDGTGTGSGPQTIGCNLDLFLDSDSQWDYNTDHVIIQADMVCDESINAQEILLDGTIESLFELI
jgi:hypothetical protein